jgi:hypothetical protein
VTYLKAFSKSYEARRGGKLQKEVIGIKMKILIICSKSFYKQINPIKQELEKKGHFVELPNEYDTPESEDEQWKKGEIEHADFKAKMYEMSKRRVQQVDAVLALNFDKNGIKNYIGGCTFLELYEAFMNNKKIYLYNEIPNGMLYDEIHGFKPVIINRDINKIS